MPLIVQFRPYYDDVEAFLDLGIGAFGPCQFDRIDTTTGTFNLYSWADMTLQILYPNASYSTQIVTAISDEKRLWLMLNLPEDTRILEETP